MRWDMGQRSRNVEDRRGMGGPVVAGGGVVAVLLIAGIVYLMGGDPTEILQSVTGPDQVQSSAPAGPRADDHDADFSKAVLGQTEQVWGEVFRQHGVTYDPPTLVLYDGLTETGCGLGQSAAGPFYCPEDRKLYLDLSFFREMDERMGAKGDFAKAYVIAHEVGHHIQTLQGGMPANAEAERGATGGSVRVELQADCYAGVWASHAKTQIGSVEAGDIEAAQNAAAAVGDDRLQKQGQGYVEPESFSHGTSAQRAAWFNRGLARGRMSDCDTFHAAEL